MSYDYRVPTRSYRDNTWMVFVALGLLFVGAIVAFGIAMRSTERTVTVHVKDKERVCSSTGSSCQYLIYTDHGTYSDKDSVWFMKFNSSDVYGNIDRNKDYTFHVTGWRLPFFSSYPNIVKVDSASR